MTQVLRWFGGKARSVRSAALSRIWRPRIKVERVDELIHLGTIYGGWTIKNSPSLHGSAIISCGVGEDVSFDVEFARKFSATVILVDPTPRSITHYEALTRRIGLPAEDGYASGGNQPPTAYDLSSLSTDTFVLIAKAIWTSDEPLRFYEPENPRHVSHSLKFTNERGSYIVVPATTMNQVLESVTDRHFSVLKLDIEGAETEILRSMHSWGRSPEQILVEFDVLRRPGREARNEVEAIDRDLRVLGYQCRHFNGDRNYLYTRSVTGQ